MVISKEQFGTAYLRLFLFQNGLAVKPASQSDFDIKTTTVAAVDELTKKPLLNEDGTPVMKTVTTETLKVDPKTKKPYFDAFQLRQVGTAVFGASDMGAGLIAPNPGDQINSLDAPHLFVFSRDWSEGYAEAWGR